MESTRGSTTQNRSTHVWHVVRSTAAGQSCVLIWWSTRSLVQPIWPVTGVVTYHVLPEVICARCGRVCLSQYQLQQHKKTHNSKQLGSMTCPECQKTFQMAHKFREHLAAHKAGTLGRNFPCVHCAKTFRKQYDLARHLKSHMGIKSHKCDECGETFVDGTRLKQHRWIHLQHRAYRCSAPGCKEAFRHKAHLKWVMGQWLIVDCDELI